MDPAPVASAPNSLVSGARLGRYQILSRLRKGGMAELYLARHVGDRGYEKIVAVKRVLPHLAEDATFVQMFLNEARIAAGLTHGNIAQVVDFGSQGDEHYLVLEYVHGTSLLELLRAAGKLAPTSTKHGGVPLPCALTIIHEVAAALHYAHEKAGSDGKPLGLVHRDVSPSNVLVSYDGEVKLVDFGIAKATAHTRVTKSGTIKGKLAYMAPEQVRGEEVDRRADVFALSVVAYELCTGRRCFVAPGEFALINRVAAGRYEKPSTILDDFPPGLEEIIVRGLAVEADVRFESARALQLAIEGFADAHGHRLSKVALSDMMHSMFGPVAYPTTDILPLPVDPPSPPAGPSPEGVPTRPTRHRNRKPATIAVAATTLVLGVGLGIGLPRWIADDATAPAEPSVPATNEAAPAQQREVVAAPPVEAPPEDEPPLVIDEDDADPSSTPASGSKRKPVPTRKRPTKAAETPAAPSGSLDYLPPSRRPG